jgi:hypothetical protein
MAGFSKQGDAKGALAKAYTMKTISAPFFHCLRTMNSPQAWHITLPAPYINEASN